MRFCGVCASREYFSANATMVKVYRKGSRSGRGNVWFYSVSGLDGRSLPADVFVAGPSWLMLVAKSGSL